MPLVTTKEIMAPARKDGYAVGAFNVANLETTIAVLKAAELEQAPVIIQVYQRLFNDQRAAMIGAMVKEWAEKSSFPVALHLDHGVSLEQLEQAIDAGYTSVMIDGSQLPFEENIELTAKGVEIAHNAGISIEAEIGHVPFGDGDIELSTPEEAVEFVEKTGVDSLAVSVGTAHGFYKKAPVLDIERAQKIGNSISIPMVLHGGSGTPEEQMKQVIKCGFAKVNVATEMQSKFVKGIDREIKNNGEKFLPVDLYFKPVEEELIDYVREKIRLFKG